MATTRASFFADDDMAWFQLVDDPFKVGRLDRATGTLHSPDVPPISQVSYVVRPGDVHPIDPSEVFRQVDVVLAFRVYIDGNVDINQQQAFTEAVCQTVAKQLNDATGRLREYENLATFIVPDYTKVAPLITHDGTDTTTTNRRYYCVVCCGIITEKHPDCRRCGRRYKICKGVVQMLG